ncbi:MAG: hypothetical protein HC900_10815, partial [Methylacidiphilales bacterium]|nr:hypothetical protein [Candidatus Methylacidiphilales bacterium]
IGSLGQTRAQRNDFFLQRGIGAALSKGEATFSISTTPDGGDQFTTEVAGAIEVAAGATIETTLTDPDNPGAIFLFGGRVTNEGTLISPAGQVTLAAARTISLTPGVFRQGVLPRDPLDPTGATDITFRAVGVTYESYDALPDGTGTVVNSGLIETLRGTTLLSGDTVKMSGVISADTSITRNSFVLIDAATTRGNVTTKASLEKNSSEELTAFLGGQEFWGTIIAMPVDNGESLPLLHGAATLATGSLVQDFIPPFIMISGVSTTLESCSLIAAPSANVHLGFTVFGQGTQPQRVLVESGAVVDVSGLNVERSVLDNFIKYERAGRNSPTRRCSATAPFSARRCGSTFASREHAATAPPGSARRSATPTATSTPSRSASTC